MGKIHRTVTIHPFRRGCPEIGSRYGQRMVSVIRTPTEKFPQPDEFEIAAKQAVKQLGYKLLCWWRDPKGDPRVWFHAVRTADDESPLLCLSAPVAPALPQEAQEDTQGGKASAGVERSRSSWHHPQLPVQRPARLVVRGVSLLRSRRPANKQKCG